MEMSKSRKPYIDLARGGVILLVVLGHLVPFGERLWLWIFAFHMPFFFIISGYCGGERNYELGFGKYFIKYAKSLLLPSLFLRALYLLIGIFTVDYASSAWAKDFFAVWISPFAEWFIAALFFSKLLFYWVHKLIRRSDDISVQKFISVFLIAVCFFVGETWQRRGLHERPAWFPLPIDCGLIGLSFVIIGYWAKREDVEELYRRHRTTVLTGGTIAVLTILWLIRFQSYTNVCDMVFGNSSISYCVFACVLSFYALVASLWLCEKTAGSSPVFRAVSLLGRHTMIVYPGHIIIHFLLNQSIYQLTGTLNTPMFDFKASLVLAYFTVDVLVLLLVCFLVEKAMPVIKARRLGTPCAAAVLALLCLAIGLRVGLAKERPDDGTAAADSAASDVTAGSDLTIDSVEDLLAFRDSVNAGTDYAGCTVVQTADIDLSGIENFEPIGLFDSGHYFCGTYDGAGHSISDLHIIREDNAALFPVLGGTVCNLTIGSGDISGACVGSFASHATVDGQARLVNCINRATVHGIGRAGGIADNFNGRIVSCINTGTVMADSGVTGGIVSFFALDIRGCYSAAAPLFPEELSFADDTLLDAETDIVRSYNLRLSETARTENLSLKPIENTGDGYAHTAGTSVYYLAGQAWYYIAAYWLDALLWVGIALCVIRSRKLRRAARLQ